MLAAAPRPPRQSFLLGESTVFWVAVVACTVCAVSVLVHAFMPFGRFWIDHASAVLWCA